MLDRALVSIIWPILLERKLSLPEKVQIQRSNVKSDKALTKTPIPTEAFFSPLVPLPTNDFLMQFMKVFLESN